MIINIGVNEMSMMMEDDMLVDDMYIFLYCIFYFSGIMYCNNWINYFIFRIY